MSCADKTLTKHSGAIDLLLKAGLPVPYSVNMGQLTPLIILENDKAPAIDLTSPAQYTPRVVMHPLMVYSMVPQDGSENEFCRPEDAGLSTRSSFSQYSDSYKLMDEAHQDLGFHPQTTSQHFHDHSNIPRSTAFDIPDHSAPLISHASFTTAPPPPPSSQPLTMFMADSMEDPAYRLWSLPNHLPASNENIYPAYVPTTHTMDFTAQQQHWYPATSLSSTPSGFGEGGQYQMALSSSSMAISDIVPSAQFASPDPYHQDGATVQVLGWGM